MAWVALDDTSTVVHDPGVIETEGERYVALPRFAWERQVELLKQVGGSIPVERLDAAVALLESMSSYTEVLAALGSFRGKWQGVLRREVERELRDWVARHGLPLRAFLHPKRSSPRPKVRRVGHPRLRDEQALRDFLKAAIDRMTLEELERWTIPVRVLLDEEGD